MKALLLTIALAFGAHGATMPPWKEILGPSQGKVPASASFTVTWPTNLMGRAFLAWFTHKFDPGDQVKLSVLDASGKEREVTYQLPPRQ